ncbi:hypothetical protein JZ751_002270 [Albula glossodonta]|uniref:Uncharacterized protein n=1 Tax=Albula glossodonta TaxID=121402 RepID=A0A8T2P7H5_9TELE|nr:hypothetical protein JZ751_002270 [Albula glossodonta]
MEPSARWYKQPGTVTAPTCHNTMATCTVSNEERQHNAICRDSSHKPHASIPTPLPTLPTEYHHTADP